MCGFHFDACSHIVGDTNVESRLIGLNNLAVSLSLWRPNDGVARGMHTFILEGGRRRRSRDRLVLFVNGMFLTWNLERKFSWNVTISILWIIGLTD